MITLAFDLGSTYYKAAVFDEALNRLLEGSIPVNYTVRDIVLAEMHPEETWNALLSLAQRVITEARLLPAQITQIAISSQAQTFALVDVEGGFLTPFISWLDTRAETLSLGVGQQLTDFHTHCSFAFPLAELALVKLLWLRQHAPGLLDRARQVAFLPGWFAQHLGARMVVDHNLAAMSGLYSLAAGDWWQKALDLVGLDTGQLPALVNMGELQGIAAADASVGFNEGVRIALCGNDQTCGAVGSGLQPGEVLVTLGTALVAYRLAGKLPGPYHPAGCWGPYLREGYYELAVASQGTTALDWACQELLPEHSVGEFMTLAGTALALWQLHGANVHFYPDAMGTPQAWQGVGDTASRALAVLVGIGFTLHQLVAELYAGADPPATVRAMGGGSRSNLWLQLLADILGVPVSRSQGDALLGAVRQVFPTISPPVTMPVKTFEPQPGWVRFFEDLLPRWLSKYPS